VANVKKVNQVVTSALLVKMLSLVV